MLGFEAVHRIDFENRPASGRVARSDRGFQLSVILDRPWLPTLEQVVRSATFRSGADRSLLGVNDSACNGATLLERSSVRTSDLLRKISPHLLADDPDLQPRLDPEAEGGPRLHASGRETVASTDRGGFVMNPAMHALSLYLDTSVIGGYFDAEFLADTRAL